jgi:outer membrane protein assembly factor BamB
VYDTVNNLVYIVTKGNHQILSIDLSNSQIKWQQQFQAELSIPFTNINKDKVFIACNDGIIYAFNPQNGENIIKYPLTPAGSIALHAITFNHDNGLLYIPTIQTLNNSETIYTLKTNW